MATPKKKMSREKKDQYRTAMRISARGRRVVRNVKSHGSIHSKVEKALIPALEKAWDRGTYTPKLVKGTKQWYRKVKLPIYIRQGNEIRLHERERLEDVRTESLHDAEKPLLPGKRLATFHKVEGVWVRVE